MIYKIDLHVHSLHSTDNNADPEETVVRAVELGLSGLAFTEHYSYLASAHVAGLREKFGASITLLRGVEFSAAEGHCLVFGVDTDKLGMRFAPIDDLIRFVNAAGGVVIPSHPFRPGTSVGDRVRSISGIAALEGCNGANMHGYNLAAIGTAKDLKLPYTGGSDAHAPSEVGSCYTEFFEPVTGENLVALLKAGNYRGVDTRKISKVILNTGK